MIANHPYLDKPLRSHFTALVQTGAMDWDAWDRSAVRASFSDVLPELRDYMTNREALRWFFKCLRRRISEREHVELALEDVEGTDLQAQVDDLHFLDDNRLRAMIGRYGVALGMREYRNS